MYGTSVEHGGVHCGESKSADMFAAAWAVDVLNCLGLSDISLHCDLGRSLERTVIRSAPRRSHQRNGALKKLSETAAKTTFGHSQHCKTAHSSEPTVDSARFFCFECAQRRGRRGSLCQQVRTQREPVLTLKARMSEKQKNSEYYTKKPRSSTPAA